MKIALLLFVLAITSSLTMKAQVVELFEIVPRDSVPESVFDTSRIIAGEQLLIDVIPSWKTRWIYYIKYFPFDKTDRSLRNATFTMEIPVDPDSSYIGIYEDPWVMYWEESVDTVTGEVHDAAWALHAYSNSWPHPGSDISATSSDSTYTAMWWTAIPVFAWAFSFDRGLNPSYGFFMQVVDSLTQPPIVGVEDKQTIALRGIFPNPADQMITVPLKHGWPHPVVVAIYDSSGKIVSSDQFVTQDNALEIPVHTLAPGVYSIFIVPPAQKAYSGTFVKG